MRKYFVRVSFVIFLGVIFALAATKTLSVRLPSDSLSTKNSLLFDIGEVKNVILGSENSFDQLIEQRAKGSIEIQLVNKSSDSVLAILGSILDFHRPTRVRWNHKVEGNNLLVEFEENADFCTKIHSYFKENHIGSKVSGIYAVRFIFGGMVYGVDGEAKDKIVRNIDEIIISLVVSK